MPAQWTDNISWRRLSAQANGGKPLGKERFYRETGIKESGCLGKFWARWSDAVRECGLEPNQMQGAREEPDLIEKFVGLMRELGKFPTANEVKMKAHGTESFPWHNTFARFGSKQQFAARIVEYGTGGLRRHRCCTRPTCRLSPEGFF